MGTLISILIVIVCILLILVVLVQNSKGGGLASSFSSSNQVMGVRKTADFLEKATWILAISLLTLSLFSSAYTKSSEGGTSTSVSRTKDMNTETAPVTPAPGIPTTTDGNPTNK